MLLLDLALVTATLAAVAIGIALPAWRLSFGLCVLLAMVAWVARAAAIATGDATTAEDYFNGLGLANTAVELLVAFGWTVLWCGVGRLSGGRRRRQPPSRSPAAESERRN